MTSWAFGEEREVSPGNYARLISVHEGWAIWSFETASGTYFGVNKPADGNRHPAPLGVGQAFFGETPFASVIVQATRPYVHFRGRHLHSKAKFRAVGARFFQEASRETPLADLDGSRVEVLVDSMPTERSYSKLVKEQAFFDMAGLLSVVVQVEKLNRLGA